MIGEIQFHKVYYLFQPCPFLQTSAVSSCKRVCHSPNVTRTESLREHLNALIFTGVGHSAPIVKLIANKGEVIGRCLTSKHAEQARQPWPRKLNAWTCPLLCAHLTNA